MYYNIPAFVDSVFNFKDDKVPLAPFNPVAAPAVAANSQLAQPQDQSPVQDQQEKQLL